LLADNVEENNIKKYTWRKSPNENIDFRTSLV